MNWTNPKLAFWAFLLLAISNVAQFIDRCLEIGSRHTITVFDGISLIIYPVTILCFGYAAYTAYRQMKDKAN